jgi:hypothetical protein
MIAKQFNHAVSRNVSRVDAPPVPCAGGFKTNIMSVTILEALQNANHNVNTGNSIALSIAKDQLNNAVVLLEKGYSLNQKVEPLLEEYGYVDNVPEKDN